MADWPREQRERAAQIALDRERDVQGSYAADQGARGTPGYEHMEKYKPGDQIFPTQHPMVDRSNVRMATVTFEDELGGTPISSAIGRHYVIPTMIDGVLLSASEAKKVAKRMGLENYPQFDSVADAEDFNMAHHGNIDESGRLIK